MEMLKIEYCLIGLDKIAGIKDEIISLSNGEASFVESKNVLISKFKSFMTPHELYNVFNIGKGRTFFIFELSPITSAVHIDVPSLHKVLFTEFDKKVIDIEKQIDDISITKITKPEDIADMFKGLFGATYGIDWNTLSAFGNGFGGGFGGGFGDGFGDHISTNKNNEVKPIIKKDEYNIDELNELSKKDRNDLIDKILSKGSDLTDSDKKVLLFLAKGE